MPTYRAPVEDCLFLLNDFLRVQDRRDLPGYAALTRELCTDVVNAAARFHEEVLFPISLAGDAEGAKLVDGRVRTPAGYRKAWDAYREAGWLQLSLPEEIGGMGLPAVLSAVVGEMRITSAHSLAMYGSFCSPAARMLSALGDGWMREHLVPRLVTGEWTATMCLTESHCGTDLRQLRTRAEPQPDGSWRITGSKIFISGGDHDLTDNIVHVVLARIPDASGSPVPGLAGINVFIVPRRHVDPGTGAMGGANRVCVSGLEHKMGIEGSATCVLDFEGAQGWRVAGPGEGTAAGMAPMFLLMNYARVSTALSGVGYAELANQNATAYARERLSGRAAGGPRYPGKPADPLIVHADVRRLLMGARAFAEGGRATALRAALWQAESEAAGDDDGRTDARDLMEVLTPVMKAFFTDRGFDAANACLQVLGGHGYIRESGLEQMVRNARIGQIYEGANGIQAIDLVQRKLTANDGRAARTLLRKLAACANAHEGHPELLPFTTALRQAQAELDLIFACLADKQPDARLAVAYDVLQSCGIAAIGWTWVEIAATVLAQPGLPVPLRKRKLALARFWMEREMPLICALRQRIQADDPAVLALADDEV